MATTPKNAQVKALTMAEMTAKYGFNDYSSEARARGMVMESSLPKQHELEADQIEAIKQTNSKGFKIIDIDPNQLDRPTFAPPYSQELFYRMFGYEFSYEGNMARVDNTGAVTPGQTSNAYWRTVELDIPGNFLKIEFLPSRMAEGFPLFAGDMEDTFTATGGVTNINVQNNTWGSKSPNSTGSKRNVMLDFENPTETPILVRDGDCYQTYFSKVLITFKQMNVRIRITIGTNSQIRSNYEKPTNLSLWSGEGFTRANQIHPTPFSITDHQVNNSSYTGITVGGSIVETALFMVDRTQAFTNNVGVGVLMVTGFSGLIWRAVNDFDGVYDFELMIGTVNGVGTVTGLDKRVAGFTCNFWRGSAGFGSSQLSSALSFPEPIRVCLKSGQALILRIVPLFRSNTIDVNAKFECKGYCFGSLAGTGFGGDVVPFTLGAVFRDHPYPNDNDIRFYPGP